jgi:hypothetical protein
LIRFKKSFEDGEGDDVPTEQQAQKKGLYLAIQPK